MGSATQRGVGGQCKFRAFVAATGSNPPSFSGDG